MQNAPTSAEQAAANAIAKIDQLMSDLRDDGFKQFLDAALERRKDHRLGPDDRIQFLPTVRSFRLYQEDPGEIPRLQMGVSTDDGKVKWNDVPLVTGCGDKPAKRISPECNAPHLDIPFRFEDVQRGLILFRTSNNAHDFTNCDTLPERLNALPQAAREELAETMRNIADELSPMEVRSLGSLLEEAEQRGRQNVIDELRGTCVAVLPRSAFQVRDQVEKYTGDYHAKGEVRGIFAMKNDAIRYVVEHPAEGGGSFCHIYSEKNLRKVEP